jgi:ankyrin repeat protein
MGGGPKLLQNLEKLIQLGLNIFAIDVKGNSAINYVLSNSKAVDLLIKHGAKPDGKALRAACCEGLIKSIEVLVYAGADIHEKDSLGRSFIFAAVHEPKVIKTLIRHGCIFDEADLCGNTPLMEAIDNGYFESAKILIKHGADIFRLNEKRDNLLHLVCRGGRYGQLRNEPEANQIVATLIKAGLPLNVQNSEGMTPLMYSVQGAGLDEILQHGPDLDLQNSFGQTALMLAAARCERGDELKQNAGKKCNTCIVKACGDNVALLLAARANRDIVDMAGKSARDHASLRAETLLGAARGFQMSDISMPIKQLIEQHKQCQSPKEFIEFLDELAVYIRMLSKRSDIRDGADSSRDIEQLYKHIERAQWGMEFKLKQVPTAQLDQCGDIYFGPLFVSSAYPWPRHNNQYLLPLLQIKLGNVSQLMGMDFGHGVLQLWGEPESFNGYQIRVIPDGDLSPQLSRLKKSLSKSFPWVGSRSLGECLG